MRFKQILFFFFAFFLIHKLTFAISQDISFPQSQISVGHYNQNYFPSEIDRPFFWGSNNQIDNGFIVSYQHLLYHTEKYFSIYLGASGAGWVSEGENIYNLSGFVAFRFWPFHTDYFSPYFLCSIAGPTLISRRYLGNNYLGEYFLFQDQLGFGIQLGKERALNVEVILLHYSNGDIFPRNSGYDVPVVLSIGYSFGSGSGAVDRSLSNFFRKFYLGLQGGYSSVNYTNANLSSDVKADSITNAGVGARLFLGYRFNSFLATELDMIYFNAPKFENLNHTFQNTTIKNNILALVGRFDLPMSFLSERLAINARAGIGYVARGGFDFLGKTVLQEKNIFDAVYGLGASYQLTNQWSIDATWMQAARQARESLPASNFYGIGVAFRFDA